MTNLSDLIAQFSKLKTLVDETDKTLRAKIDEFMESKEVSELKKLAEETQVQLDDVHETLVAEMQTQKLTTTKTESGKATISRNVFADWEDDEKLIEIASDGKHKELEEFVRVKKSVSKVGMRKALREILEIEGDDALANAGVHLKEDIRLTVTPR